MWRLRNLAWSHRPRANQDSTRETTKTHPPTTLVSNVLEPRWAFSTLKGEPCLSPFPTAWFCRDWLWTSCIIVDPLCPLRLRTHTRLQRIRSNVSAAMSNVFAVFTHTSHIHYHKTNNTYMVNLTKQMGTTLDKAFRWTGALLIQCFCCCMNEDIKH